jgi:hypothetical protein
MPPKNQKKKQKTKKTSGGDPQKHCILHPFVPRYQIQTHQNTNITAAINRSQERQPTPVPRLAMRNIFFMVPARRSRVPSKRSFIASISVLLLRTSSPMATVICFGASSQRQFVLAWGRENLHPSTSAPWRSAPPPPRHSVPPAPPVPKQNTVPSDSVSPLYTVPHPHLHLCLSPTPRCSRTLHRRLATASTDRIAAPRIVPTAVARRGRVRARALMGHIWMPLMGGSACGGWWLCCGNLKAEAPETGCVWRLTLNTLQA